MEIGALPTPQGAASVVSKAEHTQPQSGKSPDAVEAEQAQGREASGSSEKNQATEQASLEAVEAAVASIQDFVQSVRRDLNFSLEERSGRVVVKVTDSGSGDVIRQIPSEEALQLAENLSEVRSLLFKAEA
jgi:flagellar protein FlaG